MVCAVVPKPYETSMNVLRVRCDQGELTITADMEELSNALFMDNVPVAWNKRAYPSLYTLGMWYADLLQRVKELETWTADFQLPAAVWLAGFFNPQSFLTAIMQQVSRADGGWQLFATKEWWAAGDVVVFTADAAGLKEHCNIWQTPTKGRSPWSIQQVYSRDGEQRICTV